MPVLPHPFSTGFAILIASGSFAARGALFAKTLSHRGWLMALFVVAGEASVLLIASTLPGALPDWFLALLPAQWASIAIQTALTGTGTVAAMPVLIRTRWHRGDDSAGGQTLATPLALSTHVHSLARPICDGLFLVCADDAPC
jgi:hypothetical protein